MLKRRRNINEEHGFLPYDYLGSHLEGQELFDAVRIGDEMIEVGTDKVHSKGLKAFVVIDRTPKRIYIKERDWSGATTLTLTPHTVENDLFYYKHFSTKHYLTWSSKGQMLGRPEKPAKPKADLPGNRKALAQSEIGKRTMGGTVDGGYAAISDGLFCYYSTEDSVEDLSLHLSRYEFPSFKILSSTPMYFPLNILNASKQVCPSLSQFNPIKSSTESDSLALDIVGFVEDENKAFGCFTNKTFKALKKFFRADASRIAVSVAPMKTGELFFVLSTSDKSEIGVFLLNPTRTFESRNHSRISKIRGTYSVENYRPSYLRKESRVRFSHYTRRLNEGTSKGLGLASYMTSKFDYVRNEIEEWGGSIPDTLNLYVESDQFGQWDMMVGEASGRYMFSVGVRVAHDPYGGYRVYIGFPYELDDQRLEEEFPEEDRQESVNFAVELFTTACISEMFAPEEVYWK